MDKKALKELSRNIVEMIVVELSKNDYLPDGMPDGREMLELSKKVQAEILLTWLELDG